MLWSVLYLLNLLCYLCEYWKLMSFIFLTFLMFLVILNFSFVFVLIVLWWVSRWLFIILNRFILFRNFNSRFLKIFFWIVCLLKSMFFLFFFLWTIKFWVFMISKLIYELLEGWNFFSLIRLQDSFNRFWRSYPKRTKLFSLLILNFDLFLSKVHGIDSRYFMPADEANLSSLTLSLKHKS